MWDTNQRLNSKAPLEPAFVIGVGEFGQEVVNQLGARLVLTEARLKEEEGLTRLLVWKDAQGNLLPGLVQLKRIDWGEWSLSNGLSTDPFHPEAFATAFKNVDLPELSEVPERLKQYSNARAREALLDNTDQLLGIQSLKSGRVVGELGSASLGVREHDTLTQLDYPPPNQQKQLNLRIFLICAAREAFSAALVPTLVEVLGEIYVTPGLSKGITVMCYVGGTSLKEHLAAGGRERDYKDCGVAERDRIIGKGSLLAELDQHTTGTPPPIKMCYLLDARLQNMYTPVQARNLDVPVQSRKTEPDEAVAAAAIALNTMITTDAESLIHLFDPARLQTAPGKASGSKKSAPPDNNHPGRFAALGAATYVIDTHALAHVVYHRIAGYFLRSLQKLQQPPASTGLLTSAPVPVAPNQALTKYYREALRRRTQELRNLRRPFRESGEEPLSYQRITDELLDTPAPNRIVLTRILDEAVQHELSEAMEPANLLTRSENMKIRYIAETLKRPVYEHLFALYQNSEDPLSEATTYANQILNTLRRENTELRSFMLFGPSVPESPKEKDEFFQGLSHRYAEVLANNVLNAVANERDRIQKSTSFFRGIQYTQSKQKILHELQSLVSVHDEMLRQVDWTAWGWALENFSKEVEDHINHIARFRVGSLLRVSEAFFDETIRQQDYILERVFLNPQLQNEIKTFSEYLADEFLKPKQGRLIMGLIDILGKNPNDEDSLKKYLLNEAKDACQRSVQKKTRDWAETFLDEKISERVGDIRRALSDIAVPLLRYSPMSQDDPNTLVELFGVHPQYRLEARKVASPYHNNRVIDNADPLRWTFLRVRLGIRPIEDTGTGGIAFSLKLLDPLP